MKKRFGFMGVSSVLMIFIILCLTAFGVLSLTSANADLKLTEKARDSVMGYYQAQARTEELLSVIDGKLAVIRGQAIRSDGYDAMVQSALSGLDGVAFDGNHIVLTVRADENREIRTELEPVWDDGPERFRVLSRRLCISEGEMVEDGMELWPGF